MGLPTDYNERKNFPLLTVLTAYFPDAIEALVELCKQGNVQHAVDANAVNPFKLPEDKVTWDRSKSTDQVNTAMRHLWDHERIKRTPGGGYPVDSDGHLHIIKTAWRALAEAQLTIERCREEEEALKHILGDEFNFIPSFYTNDDGEEFDAPDTDALNDRLAEAAREDNGEIAELRFCDGLSFDLPLTGAEGEPKVGEVVNFGCECHPGDYKIIDIADGFPLVESPDRSWLGFLMRYGLLPSYIKGGR